MAVKALAEVPTRQDNYAMALAAAGLRRPRTPLDRPFTWTRRLLYVKAAQAAGMNYLVVRDDLGGFDQRTPSFNGWWFADDVDLAGASARYRGQFGVDTDLYVAVPSRVKLYKDTFIHDQCEPIVAQRHQAKFGKPFSEKQVLCRVEGQKGQGFLVALFPYGSARTAPGDRELAGRAGGQGRLERRNALRPAWTRGSTRSTLTESRPARPAWSSR